MFFEIEKPNRPTAVSAVLTAAIFDVENFSVSFELIRLEIIEHTVIVTVTAFAAEIGRPKSLLIARCTEKRIGNSEPDEINKDNN